MSRVLKMTSQELAAGLGKFQEDLKWFYENYDSFKDENRGKFVLVEKDKGVVLSGKDIDTLREKAQKMKINISVSVVEFVPRKDILEII